MNDSQSNTAGISTRIELTDSSLKACLEDWRPDVVARFSALNDTQRHNLARESWRIGLNAVLTAHASAQEAKLADVGKTLIEDVDRQLPPTSSAKSWASRACWIASSNPKMARSPNDCTLSCPARSVIKANQCA